MPDPVDLSALIGRPPEEIVQYFEEKGYAFSFRWQDVWQSAHARSFAVAGVMKMDALETIRGSVERALSEGVTLEEFKRELEPELRALGWWGRREVVDPDTGEIREIDLSQPWRLRTIYRTNLQTSYMAGRWKSQQAAIARRPYLRYDAVMDPSTTSICRELNGAVLRVDDPKLSEWYPPNHWGCRSAMQSLSERQVQERGLTVRSGDEVDFTPGEGWAYNPGIAAFEPDLDTYDYRTARGYVEGVLSGPKFEQMYRRLEEEGGGGVQGQTLPVAVLDDAYQAMFEAESRIVQLSDETLYKQIGKRPTLGVSDYARVQDVIERAQLITKSRDLHRVFVREQDRLYMAVVKVTTGRSELYLQSFRRTNRADVERERRRAIEILKDELD